MSQIKHAEDCKCRECLAQRNDPVTDTCSACRKRRLCKIDVLMSRDPLTGKVPTWSPRYCIAECIDLTVDERKAKRAEAKKKRKVEEPRLAWPCIGGPLDGKYAVPLDFYTTHWADRERGRYAEYDNEYETFNSAGGGYKRIGGHPTMVFIHKSLLRPMIRGRDR